MKIKNIKLLSNPISYLIIFLGSFKTYKKAGMNKIARRGRLRSTAFDI